MIIRHEQPSDQAGVRLVHESAFPTRAEANLVDLLRMNGTLAVSLVCIINEEVVGHIALSPVTVSGVEIGLGLAPVAVMPPFQRQGIGAELVNEGITEAKAQGAQIVVLLGDPQYYVRFGFKPASTWNLEDEYGGGNAFQAMVLEKNGTCPVGGLIQYCAAFTTLENESAA